MHTIMSKISQSLIKNEITSLQLRTLINCWKCNTSINEPVLICKQCNTIQKPTNKHNYFSVLNIEEKFDVDLKNLTLTYRQMQSILHPDKFVNKTIDEKNISEEYSSLINKAYNTLQTPLSRALHMLKLKNVRIDENDKATDPQFLMEILELNEEIEDCDTDDKLQVLNNKNKDMLNKISKDIENYLKANDVIQAKSSVIRMKYYDSISQRINHLLREKGIVE